MNEVNVLLADREDFKFVECVFAPYTGKQTYTHKTLLKVEVEDFLVVDTPSNGFQVVQVRNVLSPLEVDFDANYEYKWVVCGVDTEAYEKAKELEKSLRKHVNKSKNKRALKNAKEQILEGLDDASREEATKLVRL